MSSQRQNQPSSLLGDDVEVRIEEFSMYLIHGGTGALTSYEKSLIRSFVLFEAEKTAITENPPQGDSQ